MTTTNTIETTTTSKITMTTVVKNTGFNSAGTFYKFSGSNLPAEGIFISVWRSTAGYNFRINLDPCTATDWNGNHHAKREQAILLRHAVLQGHVPYMDTPAQAARAALSQYQA